MKATEMKLAPFSHIHSFTPTQHLPSFHVPSADKNTSQILIICIQAVIGEWPEELAYEDALKDGVLLCK
jgi:hypothetical protein